MKRHIRWAALLLVLLVAAACGQKAGVSDKAAAPESCWRVQPNSASIGLMKTPKTARIPEPARTTKTTAARRIQP